MCSEKNCCCIKLETGTLIYGIIASIINVLILLILVGGFIGFNVVAYQMSLKPYHGHFLEDSEFQRVDFSRIAQYDVGMIVMVLKTIMDLVFTVRLCTGITKRKPSRVHAYYIYGLVMLVINTILVIALAASSQDLWTSVGGASILVFFALVMYMVYLTHQKMIRGEIYGFEHKRLAESVY